MANLFASDCILLVGEGEVRVAHPHDDVLVIQRCSRGVVASVFDVEFDVLEFEGFASSVARALYALRRAEEPEECDEDDVDDMSIEGAHIG